jgi:hypothetical protein
LGGHLSAQWCFKPSTLGVGDAGHEQMALTHRQQSQRTTLIGEKNHDPLQTGSLRPRETVGELIERRYGMRLSISAVDNSLRRWA